MTGDSGMLGEAVRLETIEIRACGGQAKMLEGKFSGTRTNLTAGSWVGAAARRIKAATNVAGGAWVLGEKTVPRLVETAGGGGG